MQCMWHLSDFIWLYGQARDALVLFISDSGLSLVVEVGDYCATLSVTRRRS